MEGRTVFDALVEHTQQQPPLCNEEGQGEQRQHELRAVVRAGEVERFTRYARRAQRKHYEAEIRRFDHICKGEGEEGGGGGKDT